MIRVDPSRASSPSFRDAVRDSAESLGTIDDRCPVPTASSPVTAGGAVRQALGPSFGGRRARLEFDDRPDVGRNRMDLSIVAECAPVGAGERIRTYTADIVEDRGPATTRVEHFYDATHLVALGARSRFPSAGPSAPSSGRLGATGP